jgi:hypothetical protein
MEEVAMSTCRVVLKKVGNNILLIAGNPQGILDQKH